MALVHKEMWMTLTEDGKLIDSESGVITLAPDQQTLEKFEDADAGKATKVRVTIEVAE